MLRRSDRSSLTTAIRHSGYEHGSPSEHLWQVHICLFRCWCFRPHIWVIIIFLSSSPWPDAAWTCSWFPVSGPGCRCVLLRETKGYYGFIGQISRVRVHRVHTQGTFLVRFRCQQGGGKPVKRSNVLTSCFLDYICVLMMKVLSATLLQTEVLYSLWCFHEEPLTFQRLFIVEKVL